MSKRRSQKVGKSESPEGSVESEVESPEPKAAISKPKAERQKVVQPEAEASTSPHSAIDVPPSELTKSEIEHPNSEIKMEVHHHPQLEHKPKPWKEYVLEGLMIFIAVTMGFFAENLRERISDDHREQQFAQTLYAELAADSVKISQIVRLSIEKEHQLDYLYKYFKDSSLTVLPRQFYPALTEGLFMINSSTFEPKDGILSQLKSTGGMQYFKDAQLQKFLGDLSVSINNIRYRNDQMYQFFASPLKAFLLQHFDFSWLDQVRTALSSIRTVNDLLDAYRKSKLNFKGELLNPNGIDRAEAANMMLFNKQMLVSTRSLQLTNYTLVNHQILEALRKLYTVHNE